MSLVALQPVSGQTMIQASGAAVSVSGNIIAISGTVAVSTSISGNVVAISGSVTTITSISGNVVSISGTAAVSTSISGNVVSVSGLWTSTTLQSGQVGVSGAAGVLNFVYDYSGVNWVPMPTSTSGVRIPRFTNSGDASTTSISGNVVSISGSVTTITSISGNVVSVSGTATIAGAVTTSVSGNSVKPQTPTFINTLETFRISVASGGVQLSSFACVACTVRNIGVSGDVILIGSLSSPPYFGTSGEAYPATSGKGFWLRDGDAITLNTTDTANIKVTANLSGTTVAYIAIG